MTKPTEDQDKPSSESDGPPRGALIALLVVVVVAIGGYWLSQHLRAANRTQDCVMSGRTNCAPVQ